MKTTDILLIGAVAVGVMALSSRLARAGGLANLGRDALVAPPRATDGERSARQWATEQAYKPFAFFE